MTHSDEYWMKKALALAAKAATKGEVPVAALVIKDNQLVSTGQNRRETLKTPLGHAELIALQRASQKLGAWRLLGCTLYVTLEPCVMCAGALVQARISKVVFGAMDAKGGAVQSLFNIGKDPRLNHRFEVVSGVLAEPCSRILSDFFKSRRG
ncbi:MAG: tRNA adenosine(34) deaminase TadA [Bdellovibrio sp. CG10_big_fil_rev_8_21_14_0_10_47_8]|nr:MAG: tRNA adenosine(34) deaminase TadA [Bdellovibrio sp. CG10_big_fil_rev_8_21_14_0_10_47_8]